MAVADIFRTEAHDMGTRVREVPVFPAELGSDKIEVVNDEEDTRSTASGAGVEAPVLPRSAIVMEVVVTAVSKPVRGIQPVPAVVPPVTDMLRRLAPLGSLPLPHLQMLVVCSFHLRCTVKAPSVYVPHTRDPVASTAAHLTRFEPGVLFAPDFACPSCSVTPNRLHSCSFSSSQ